MVKRNPRAWPCFHFLVRLEKFFPDQDGGKPFRYRCTKCGALLKIASGFIKKEVVD